MTDTVKQIVPGLTEVNSSTLVIGRTGAGKSFLLATAYEYVWEEYGRVSLHYNSDPGGFPDKLRALVAHGIVRVWRMQSRGIEYSFETAALAARGYWPASIEPKSGMSPKGVKLIPPVVTTYIETCGFCQEEAGRSIVQATLLRGACPKCGKIRSHQTSNVQQLQTVSRGFENIGTRGYDGLTSISDWYLQDMSKRTDLGGEAGALGGKIVSGDMSWQQNNRAQVGFAQSRAHELVTNSLEIPGMIVMPLWTAISEESTDDGGLRIVGPKLAGSAKTDIAPQWFGNVFEASLEQNDQGRKVRRLYLSSYVDKQNRNHLLRHRGDPRLIPEMVEDEAYGANGQPPAELGTGFNLGRVFRALDASLAKSIEDVGTRYPNAPGLANVPSRYGMDVSPEALQQTPQVQTGPQIPVGSKPVVAAPRVARAPAKPRTAGAGVATAAASPTPAPAQEGTADPRPADPPTSPSEPPLPMEPAQLVEGAPLAQTVESPVTSPAAPVTPAADPAPATLQTAPAPPSGAWAPPPGAARLSAPRAPAAPPKARPVARPTAPSTTKTS